ncbi:MAG: YaaA family protein [Bacilli bacterium]|nr:YaaA family protein [Bacilli bacterium]MBN2876305.1 YaaA family protein [Bacilli bacterium]
MKIILSPSKTMNIVRSDYLQSTAIKYDKMTLKLVRKMQKLKIGQLGKALSIKGNVLNQTYEMYYNYESNESGHAFPSFNGLVYKQLTIKTYLQEEWNYISKHIRILDALHGILNPGTLMKPYRLDMKSDIELNLYDYWELDSEFKDELVINLASKEFSSMLSVPMITIQFLENKNGKYINQATYSKMARGKMLQYMILNKIESIEKIKNFHEDNYKYNEELSNLETITFVR